MLLRVDKAVAVYGIELELMPAHVDILLYKRRDGLNPVLGIKDRRMELHRERSAVYRASDRFLREGADDGERSL